MPDGRHRVPLDREDLRFLMSSPADEEQGNPIDQLVDLFVYAPVGLLYEYEDVLPKLIKRGKSQVQLARVLGQLAVKGKGADIDVNDVAGVASTLVARAVTEFGAMVGLAPDKDAKATPPPPPGPTGTPPPPPPKPPATTPALEATDEHEDDLSEPEETPAPSLPIANYDDLTAREIIPLLESLSPKQRSVVRDHEAAGRSRKTVLAKLDRLDR